MEMVSPALSVKSWWMVLDPTGKVRKSVPKDT